jgi:serine protein kinase
MDWLEEVTKNPDRQNQIFSFNEYMDYFKKNAILECRPSAFYLIDMINYFGKTNDGQFKIFLHESPDSPAVYGQDRPEQAIYENLLNFLGEGFNNKFILLVGPNGSSKSSIVRKLMKGAELYSETEEGILHTFSWIFPNENLIKGSLGLTGNSRATEIETYSTLDDKNISAIIPSEMKDHPLLLIPLKLRQKIIEKYLGQNLKLFESIKKSYLYQGDLSKKNRMIFDALLKNYKGDVSQVLKHVKVERFTISLRYSNGAVTIEPQIHVDARMQQITMDRRLQSLPPSLQSLNLYSLQGEVVLANRGILEYSDLLKRPLDAFKYLLMTMESGTINLSGILTELDIFFLGTSNEIHLAGFKQHPDFNSFKGRFNFIKVPYLLDYKSEKLIYQKQLESLISKAYFEPHSLEVLCLFAVMTRLRACHCKNYSDKALANLAPDLNPLEKALLLSNDAPPSRFDFESQQILENGIDQIRNEYSLENLYEGKFGLSPRDIKKINYKLSSEQKNITFIDVLDYLDRLNQEKNEYDFLNMTAQGDYHNPQRFIGLLKDYALDIFDSELRQSLGLIDERSYEEYIKKYITNINALLKGEKIPNHITGKYENFDEFFIKEFEQNINLLDNPNKFRSYLISKLGAYALDNPRVPIFYCKVFPDIVHKLQESFRNEQKKNIENLAKVLIFYNPDDNQTMEINSSISEKDRAQISLIFQNLVEKFGHSSKGAAITLKYLIKERY